MTSTPRRGPADDDPQALDTLGSHPQGFFLFVEDEGVDEFAHNNNSAKVLQSMAQLDTTHAPTSYVSARSGSTESRTRSQ